MNPAARRMLYRRLLKKSYGANVAGNGASLPVTFTFDDDTVGQPTQHLVAELGAGASVVVADPIDGLSNSLHLPDDPVIECATVLDLGAEFDFTAGIRVQMLVKMDSNTKFDSEWLVSKVGDVTWGENYIFGRFWEGDNPDTFRCINRIGGVSNDTGAVNVGGAEEGVGGSYHYWRMEADPAGNLTTAAYTTAGALVTGSNGSTAFPGGSIPSAMRYFHLRSHVAWFGSYYAAIWVGDLTTAWPTAGEPS